MGSGAAPARCRCHEERRHEPFTSLTSRSSRLGARGDRDADASRLNGDVSERKERLGQFGLGKSNGLGQVGALVVDRQVVDLGSAVRPR